MSLFVLSLLTFPLAHGEVPLPLYPECGEAYRPDLCPSDLGDRWWMISYIPEHSLESVRAGEIPLGSGGSVDRALRTTTGNWNVIVAVGDSGIEWKEEDLANKIHLNVQELPAPWWVDGDGTLVETVCDAGQPREDCYDLDGNGLVNLADYGQDPRVLVDAGVAEADHMLDPSDLIYTFSDGVDDDANGYADDIAGWDFFADDNDPYSTLDSGYGTHGTGVLEDIGAEGGNGHGMGVCPGCSLLPVRVGDTFVVDGTRTAQGIAFAADSGARVMNLSVGALSDPDLARQAVEYARVKGMVLVGAAGDENAYHHNLPAMHADFLYAHSVHYNTADRDDAVYSYLNFFNCNNYGPRMDVVAGSDACATGAAAITSGAAGMILSVSEELGLDLDVDEVRQLLISNLDDIWLTAAETEEAKTYPSSEGWDPFYGYGRINVAKMVEAAAAGEIPPVGRILSPGWFELVDPGQGGSLEVAFEARANRASSFSWELAWGQGWEPSGWTVLEAGTGSAPLEEVRVTLDLSDVEISSVPEPDIFEGVIERVERVHGPAVSFRLRVTDDAGRVGESRRTVFVYEDPDLLTGFPLDLEGSGESSPVLADLDGDGVFEILLATASGEVLAVAGDGSFVPGWPVTLPVQASILAHADAPAYADGFLDADQPPGIIATVAVGDLDGDGSPEVVTADGTGGLHVFSALGAVVPGFPVALQGREPEEFDGNHAYDNGFAGAPTLYDLDGDGDLEILVPGMDSRLYIWHHDGSEFSGYPREICHPDNCGTRGHRIITSVTVGDVDGDGDADIGFGSNETVRNDSYSVTHLFDALSGVPLDGWPREEHGLVNEAALLPTIGEGHPASLAFGDMDGDGDLEIIDAVMLGQADVLDHRGGVALDLHYAADQFGQETNSDEPSFVAMSNNPAFGDLDCDGVLDPLMGGAGTFALVGLALTTAVDFQHVLGGWRGATGEFFEGWPRQVEDFQFLVAPAVADVSGDGVPEVIYTSAGGVFHAWDRDGDAPDGWPKFTGQWFLGSPALGDINGDGWLDVVATTREGWLYAWTTRGRADQKVQWAGLHHDPQNTGNYETPLVRQEGPEEGIGGCCKRRKGADQGWLLAPLMLLSTLRRRRL